MDSSRNESNEVDAADDYRAALDALRDAFERASFARERCRTAGGGNGSQYGISSVSRVEAAWGSDTFECVVIQALNKWPRR